MTYILSLHNTSLSTDMEHHVTVFGKQMLKNLVHVHKGKQTKSMRKRLQFFYLNQTCQMPLPTNIDNIMNNYNWFSLYSQYCTIFMLFTLQ